MTGMSTADHGAIEVLQLGLLLGGTAVAFGLCLGGIVRLRRTLAEEAVTIAIRPYRLSDLDPSARLARERIVRRYAVQGARGYTVIVTDLFAWSAGLCLLTGAGQWWWQASGHHVRPGLPNPLGWLPYTPAIAVLTGFAVLLHLLAHDPVRRPDLRLARWGRLVLPRAHRGYVDPECAGDFGLLRKATAVRSCAAQQANRDQVADLAHLLLPQIRDIPDDELKKTIEGAIAFAPRRTGRPLDTDRFAELLALFDALFGRLREDSGHQDIWRIAILRQLIRCTGPDVLPEIFGQIPVLPGATDELPTRRSIRRGPQHRSTDDLASSVLNTAFGRSLPRSDAEGLDLIVDLTRAPREDADEQFTYDDDRY